MGSLAGCDTGMSVCSNGHKEIRMGAEFKEFEFATFR